MKEEDLETVYAWRNLDRVREFMFNSEVIEFEIHRKWFIKILSQSDVDYQILEYLGRPIGQANATNIDLINKNCDWGFYLGEEGAERGSGTVLGLFMLDYLFENYQMENVCAQVLEKNTASLGLHKKLGFISVGQFEKELINKSKVNVVKMSLDKNFWIDKSLELNSQLFAG